MSEFKQIIGRGTRIEEDFDKMFFTIMDFKGVTRLFSDPDFDGEPEEIYEPGPWQPVVCPGDDIDDEPLDGPDGLTPGRKYYVKNQFVEIIGEEVKYIGADGNLITESFVDYTKKVVCKKYETSDHFAACWKESNNKKELIDELREEGLLTEPLQEKINQNVDVFDLINYFVFGKGFLTKEQRIKKVKTSAVFSLLGMDCRKIISELLKKYSHNGVESLENLETLKTPSMGAFGTPLEIINRFQGKENYIKTIRQILNELY